MSPEAIDLCQNLLRPFVEQHVGVAFKEFNLVAAHSQVVAGTAWSFLVAVAPDYSGTHLGIKFWDQPWTNTRKITAIHTHCMTTSDVQFLENNCEIDCNAAAPEAVPQVAVSPVQTSEVEAAKIASAIKGAETRLGSIDEQIRQLNIERDETAGKLDSLRQRLRDQEYFKICVRKGEANVYELQVKASYTAADVKAQLIEALETKLSGSAGFSESKTPYSHSMIDIFVDGNVLFGKKTLKDRGIQSGDVLTFAVRQSAASPPPGL